MFKINTNALLAIAAPALLLVGCGKPAPPPPEGKWIRLFDGETFEGWIPKFTHHPLGVNLNNTFQAGNGVLRVSYDGYDRFRGEYGHLFYEKPYSHYWLRFEYRFAGEQVPNGPSWARRNNGVMLHAQPPGTMSLDQDFPRSVEFRLLGGLGEGKRPTGGLCMLGVTVLLDGARTANDCIIPDGRTFHGDRWVKAAVEVNRGRVIRHMIEGLEVMQYSNPLLNQAMPWSDSLQLTSGHIALQAETAPTEFRNIELLDLEVTTAKVAD